MQAASAPAPTVAPPPGRNATPRPNSGAALRPLLNPEQEKDLQRQIDENLAAAERSLARLRAQRLSRDQQSGLKRIEEFIDQAQQARRAGQLSRAGSLAERAKLLALDLARTSP